jgi:hypothetical protein
MNLESYARIDENAKIQGVALIPRISRNNNLYTKEELRRFDGVTVPLNWEHDGNKVIGEATFHYNSELETVYYEGIITDPSAAMLAKNKLLFTSIEATPTDVKRVCNGNSDCFQMPFGLVPEGLALTETPGVPETSVEVLKESLEKTLKECMHHDHNEFEKYGAADIIHKTIKPRQEANDCVQRQISKLSDEHPEWKHDQVVAVAHSKCGVAKEGWDNPADKSVDNIMKDTLAYQAEQLEGQLKSKQDALELFHKVMANNEDPLLHDYIALLQQDVEFLTNQLIGLRKDGEYVAVESLDKLVSNMKERYVCDCCGDIKKKLI